MDLERLQERLRAFAEARDWERFHDAKNLSMALAVESAELLEVFQWMTTEQAISAPASQGDVDRAGEELADVLIYAVRLADVMGIDLDAAVESKLALNEERYPVHLAKGNAVKYDRREQ